MKIVLSTVNMVALIVWIHDRYHFVLCNARIYGSDIIEINFGKQWNPNNIHYEVFPTETTFLDKESDPCLSERRIADKNVWQCLEDFRDSSLNCTLPWRSKNDTQEHPLCSTPWEYDNYIENFPPNDPIAIRNISKCSPGCKRNAYSTEVYKQWEDKTEPGMLELQFFYQQYEVPVRKHVYAYDEANLISDIGGYLGLLLGYSVLAFYDTSVFFIGKIMKFTIPRRITDKPTKILNSQVV